MGKKQQRIKEDGNEYIVHHKPGRVDRFKAIAEMGWDWKEPERFPLELRDDEELVAKAVYGVGYFGSPLEYASPRLRSNVRFVLE